MEANLNYNSFTLQQERVTILQEQKGNEWATKAQLPK
jgi:hypothetical protein